MKQAVLSFCPARKPSKNNIRPLSNLAGKNYFFWFIVGSVLLSSLSYSITAKGLNDAETNETNNRFSKEKPTTPQYTLSLGAFPYYAPSSPDFWQKNKQATLLYYTNSKLVELSFEYNAYRIFYLLNAEQLSEFRSMLNTYFQWQELATQNGDILKRQIDTIKDISTIFNYSDNFFKGKSTIIFTFFAQDPARHQLLLEFSKTKSRRNSASIEPATMYIEKETVEEIAQLLSESNIRQQWQQAKQNEDRYKFYLSQPIPNGDLDRNNPSYEPILNNSSTQSNGQKNLPTTIGTPNNNADNRLAPPSSQ